MERVKNAIWPELKADDEDTMFSVHLDSSFGSVASSSGLTGDELRGVELVIVSISTVDPFTFSSVSEADSSGLAGDAVWRVLLFIALAITVADLLFIEREKCIQNDTQRVYYNL